MRKLLILLGFVGGMLCNSAHAGQMVNVEYIHLLIEQKWGIAIPYNPSVTNPKVAANMEYLLGMVDIANKRLNGDATTDYLHSEYATKYAADTIAAIDAADRLIKIEPKFFVTTTSTTSSFSFQMSARGMFVIDWGDGTRDIIKRTDTTNATYSHTYTTAGEYTIGIGGHATEYSTADYTAAISFMDNTNVAGISGSLGAIFSTIGDGSGKGQQPRFYKTFSSCGNLSGSIPEKLFAWISGKPVICMFASTFSGCGNLSGSIPENLFGDISGAPADWMFRSTFNGCGNLSGSIPEHLFGDISGAPASSMFYSTFFGCSKLSGVIPEKLFGEFSGAPAYAMFLSAFDGCSGLSGSIPESLFAGISGPPAEYMFERTFYGCSGLTGTIPENLFGDISGAPASYMFNSTFSGCSGLTGCIPDGLFGDITDMNLDEIIETYSPLYDTSVTQEYCSILGPKFFVTTTADTTEFEFTMSAAGTFMIDWGDGTHDIIKRTDTTKTVYSHMYTAAGEYTIGIGGHAMEYNTKSTIAAISFVRNSNLAEISGSLGAIFSTIGNGRGAGQQPRFYDTFGGCGNLSGSIPENLFTGVSGAPVSYMFCGTFYSSGLTSIPAGLFAGISGRPAEGMFSDTFNGCSNLSGSIPENLFAGISGRPAADMFLSTFEDCAGLSGSIPEKLFVGIKGAPAEGMFYQTFTGCSGLSGSIPGNLFAGISGAPAEYMFERTFSGCSNLSGSIPENLFAGISGRPAAEMFLGTFEDCAGLSGSIPEKLFSGISGAPALFMFGYTFSGCSGLIGSIPENLFGKFSGAPAQYMFTSTFKGCSGLTSIPENLFGDISGTAQYGMFASMFYGCTSLTGASAKINGKYLYEIWPKATSAQVGGCYSGDTGLADYADISAEWK